MFNLVRSAGYELKKLVVSVRTLVLVGLLFGLQGVLEVVQAKAVLDIGLDATPQTHPELAAPVGPLSLQGFDVLPFGETVLIGALVIAGVSEWKTGEIVTSHVAHGKRSLHFVAKALAAAVFTAVFAFSSIVFCISLTHIALGEQGLTPVILDGVAWQAIITTTCAWTMLGIGGYLMSLSAKHWGLGALVFVVPTMGIADVLAPKAAALEFVPARLAHNMARTSGSTFDLNQVAAAASLCSLTLTVGLVALFIAQRRVIKP